MADEEIPRLVFAAEAQRRSEIAAEPEVAADPDDFVIVLRLNRSDTPRTAAQKFATALEQTPLHGFWNRSADGRALRKAHEKRQRRG